MVSIQEGHFVPLYFKNIIDPETGRTRVRMVDIRSEYYSIARRYMIRLNQSDFDDSHELAKFAAVCGVSVDEFRARFSYLVEHDRVHREAADKIVKLATAG
jgi:6-phosphofructokinase 1